MTPTDMTPFGVVSVLAVGQLIAFAVIAVLVLVCISLYNARRRKVRQLAALNRELGRAELDLQVARTRLTSAEHRLAQLQTVDRKVRPTASGATVQFTPASAPVVGQPAPAIVTTTATMPATGRGL